MVRPSDWQVVFGFGDPTPGDPYSIRAVARRWSGIAESAGYAETRLRGLLGDEAFASWIGKAGEKFRSRSSDLPDQLRKTKDSYHDASGALSWWAGQLESHQGTADRALVQGRAARADLLSAQQQLSSASGSVSSASHAGALSFHGDLSSDLAPTPQQISAARGRLASAQAAESHAQGLVNDAQSRLDAARRLAVEAGHLRESDGRTAAQRLHDAADAGIKPRSFWDKVGDAIADSWHVVVAIAKVVVAVLGVVALIIGGPIAWIVFAAALIVLADTLMKYANGQASLFDVGLALLGCIPGTKGLTTLSELSTAFKAGGMLGAGAHLLGAGKTAIVGLGAAVRSIGRSANLMRQGLVPGVRAAVSVLGRERAFVLPELRTSLTDAISAFRTSMRDGNSLVKEARSWQGSGAFPGRDTYAPTFLPKGTDLEAGFPGLSNYATDAGTAAAANHEASTVWEGLQVGPMPAGGDIPAGYRGSMVQLHLNSDMTVASGTTLANAQYGAGGTVQHFFDIKSAIANGDVSVIDHAGSPIHIPDGMTPQEVNAFLASEMKGHGPIALNHPTHINLGIADQSQIAHYDFHLPPDEWGTRKDVLDVLKQTGSLIGSAGTYL
ncbi:hypothetical protein [Nocardioides terrisoli]|uniref:hypothetical protein n=1 Tax=Nocardioides terrisoli TaxID=3388267 RepID=UPI00287BB1C6|nr:hypothetical protein [Nocardioides marmorisolisilvae]